MHVKKAAEESEVDRTKDIDGGSAGEGNGSSFRGTKKRAIETAILYVLHIIIVCTDTHIKHNIKYIISWSVARNMSTLSPVDFLCTSLPPRKGSVKSHLIPTPTMAVTGFSYYSNRFNTKRPLNSPRVYV